jgi:hypothetical protein
MKFVKKLPGRARANWEERLAAIKKRAGRWAQIPLDEYANCNSAYVSTYTALRNRRYFEMAQRDGKVYVRYNRKNA